MNKPLPRPVSVTDKYLAAIHVELVMMNRYLAQAGQTAVPDEPEQPASQPGQLLPADFPGRDPLAQAGIVYLATVPRTMDELTAVTGIGMVTAEKILASLGMK